MSPGFPSRETGSGSRTGEKRATFEGPALARPRSLFHAQPAQALAALAGATGTTGAAPAPTARGRPTSPTLPTQPSAHGGQVEVGQLSAAPGQLLVLLAAHRNAP